MTVRGFTRTPEARPLMATAQRSELYIWRLDPVDQARCLHVNRPLRRRRRSRRSSGAAKWLMVHAPGRVGPLLPLEEARGGSAPARATPCGHPLPRRDERRRGELSWLELPEQRPSPRCYGRSAVLLVGVELADQPRSQPGGESGPARRACDRATACAHRPPVNAKATSAGRRRSASDCARRSSSLATRRSVIWSGWPTPSTRTSSPRSW